MFKKIASFMLAVLCCAPIFAGCGSADNTDTSVNDTTAANEATETTVPEETRVKANLPEMNYDGKELRIYTWTHEETKVQNDFSTGPQFRNRRTLQRQDQEYRRKAR